MKRYHCLFMVLIAFQACAPVYVPSPAVHFNNTKKGDAHIGGTLANFNIGLQSGYALTDHINIGLTLNSKRTREYSVFNNINRIGIGAVEVQAIAGVYGQIGTNQLVELNAGYGHSFTYRPDEIGNQTNVFIQPSFILFKPSTIYTFCAATRFNYLMFDEQVMNGTLPEVISHETLFFEPSFLFTYGDNLKGMIQLGLSLDVVNDLNPDYQPLILNIGMRYNLRKGQGLFKTKERGPPPYQLKN